MDKETNDITKMKDNRVEKYKRFIAHQLKTCNNEEALCFVANYLVQTNTEDGARPSILLES